MDLSEVTCAEAGPAAGEVSKLFLRFSPQVGVPVFPVAGDAERLFDEDLVVVMPVRGRRKRVARGKPACAAKAKGKSDTQAKDCTPPPTATGKDEAIPPEDKDQGKAAQAKLAEMAEPIKWCKASGPTKEKRSQGCADWRHRVALLPQAHSHRHAVTQ